MAPNCPGFSQPPTFKNEVPRSLVAGGYKTNRGFILQHGVDGDPQEIPERVPDVIDSANLQGLSGG